MTSWMTLFLISLFNGVAKWENNHMEYNYTLFLGWTRTCTSRQAVTASCWQKATNLCLFWWQNLWFDWPASSWTSPGCSCAPPSTSSRRPSAAPDTPLGPPATAAFPPSWNSSGRPSGTCSDALSEFNAFTTLSTKTMIYRYRAVRDTLSFQSPATQRISKRPPV